MNSKLYLAWCSYEAAKYAVMHWHYSRTMPVGKLVKIGVWEDDAFIGVVIFGGGACPRIGDPYKITNIEACELVRVALKQHKSPVSKIVAISIKLLAAACPKLRIIISFADPEQGHVGSIYQAGNWIYTGPTIPCEFFEYTATGERVHPKTIRNGRRGWATELKKQGIIRVVKTWKYKYLMPLDVEMRKQIEPLQKPYPKRVISDTGDTLSLQDSKGGSTPTIALSEV